MKFSVIIPSYNEGDDIRLSIESAINQNEKDKEILVVDDSTDNTKNIIKEYKSVGVKLIDGKKQGCCGARNLGIKIATGDIVVLLNADVILPYDFLNKISKHYENGADYVLVESEVFNRKSVWARFIEMQHRFEYKHRNDIEWTEGFSCKREVALSVGGIPGEFSITFCRDWLLGVNLNKAGFKKIVDKSILVTHKAPETFSEYWRVRKARGRFGALNQYYIFHRAKPNLFLKFIVKDIFFVLKFLTIIPAFYRVYKISKLSDRSLRDFFPFYVAYFIQELARAMGEWQGWKIAKKVSL
ncbi:MAG: glycosyltransferase family 2 protein [Patescibacteria group bacterium]